MNRARVKEALTEFIEAPELQVAALSGNWGVGKTYLWSEFAKTVALPEAISGVSYASLFGATSLDELRLRVATGLVRKPETLRQVAARWASWIVWATKGLFGFLKRLFTTAAPTWVLARLHRYVNGNAWALMSDASYWFVRHTLVALDDLERRSSSLDLITVFGFVDELRSRGCKVVLITNSSKLDEADRDKYWEKVVDLDLTLAPNADENSEIALGSAYQPAESAEHARTTLKALRCDNLRIHKRAGWLLRRMAKVVEGLSLLPQVRKQLVVNATTLCWVSLNPDRRIPLNIILEPEHHRMWSMFADQDDKISDEEREWAAIVAATGFEPFECNAQLSALISTGSCDNAAFRAALQNTDREVDMARARQRLQDTYLVYTNSFNTGRDQYVQLVRTVLREEVDKLWVHSYADVLSQLQSCGDDTGDLAKLYIERNGAHLDKVAEERGRQEVPEASLEAEVKRREGVLRARRHTIDSVARHLATSDGYGREHIEFLSARTPDEYRTWILSEPPDLGHKLKALLRFRNDAAPQRTIAEAVVSALQDLGSRSDFDTDRVKRAYAVEPAHAPQSVPHSFCSDNDESLTTTNPVAADT